MKAFGSILLIFSFLINANSYSQNASFMLHQDERIATLYNHKDSIVICHFFSSTIKGYRVLIEKIENREKAYSTKEWLQKQYDSRSVYMSYQTLFFILKMGDFVSRQTAENCSYRINKEFNFHSIVVPDKVYSSKISDEEQPCIETATFPNYL